MNHKDFYNNNVKPLSTVERLRLAKMILNEIPSQAIADYSEEWNEQDLKDFARASSANAEVDDGAPTLEWHCHQP